MLSWLASFLSGPIVNGLIGAYKAKLEAGNTSERIAADLAARELAVEQREREVAAQVIIAEQGRCGAAASALCRCLHSICLESGGVGQGVRPWLDRRAFRRRSAMGDDRADRVFRRPKFGEGGSNFGARIVWPCGLASSP